MGATPAVLENLSGAFARHVAYANPQVWLSAHSANPGTTGLHEITAGTGAAGRQQVTFNSGGSGSDPSNVTAQIAFVGPVTIPWVGFWSAQTGGTFLGGYPLVSDPEIATVANDATGNVTVPNHGLAVNTPVRLYTAPNAQSAIPGGVTTDTVFFVATVVSADVIQLSPTTADVPIIFSSSGGFIITTDQSRTIEGAGILVFNIGNIIYETVS